ncbi:MAG: efflux RND transporter periplasmic adaptor subunit, partial [Alphaproteobacteria bacterium]|nr:efflux RND transporter periplasmic adaptor subunit [Alphaproteobacteria bacterium]
MRKWIAGALVLAAAGAVAWYVLPQLRAAGGAKAVASSATKTAALSAHVSVESARREEIVETITVTGSLTARREVLAGPEIDGLRIIEILAEEGDRVTKDQVLVRLSRETLDALVAQSDAGLARADAMIAQTRSQIAQAQANVTWTSADLRRAQELLGRGASTQAIVDQKLNASRTAQAQLEALRNALVASEAENKNLGAQRRELMIRVTRTEVRAPAGGVISRRSAKLGALAAAAAPEPLFRI